MVIHKSASSSHYNKESAHYDELNEQNSAVINVTLEHIFRKNGIKTILDLTCGTGSQVFWLSKQGFDVIGYDINSKMIAIAKRKVKEAHLKIKFAKGDMRTTHAGQFDAVITIFNAIGHLTKSDFEKAIQNISTNLKTGGLYVFDIFNLSYLLAGDNITELTIDNQIKKGDIIVREIQYSTISEDGILASYDIYHEQKPGETPKITKAFQTLQVYNRSQLKALLEKCGFQIVEHCDINGGTFWESKTERLLTVAQKK